MFAYYVRLALISIRGRIWLSALMVAAIGIGIGTFMTMLTVNYVMASDPISDRSHQLFYVRLDSWDPQRPFNQPSEPPNQLTWIDATALMKAARAPRQTASARVAFAVQSETAGTKPFLIDGRATHADFFPMFGVSFRYGSGWDARADADREQVAVLTRELNDRVFGDVDSVGRNIELGGHQFRVVGVIDDWKPIPRVYDLTGNPFGAVEDAFVPFTLVAALRLDRRGNTNCWKSPGDGLEGFLASECVWIQFWAELPSAADVSAYKEFVDAYVGEQKRLGRFARPLDNRLTNARDWLRENEVVPDEARMMLVIGLMFLFVCVLNTVGLLLAKFTGKAAEIGVRRALGGSQRALFTQYAVESACIGVAGGILGLALAWLGLRGVDVLFGELVAPFTRLDAVMVTAAIALAVVASLLAGFYPTWRACNIAPASALKAQ